MPGNNRHQNRTQKILENLKRMTTRSNPDQSERQKIFEELDRQPRPIRRRDMPRRIELCQRALEITSKNEEPELWGGLQDDLANCLAYIPSAGRAENLEQAIQHFNDALTVRLRQNHP